MTAWALVPCLEAQAPTGEVTRIVDGLNDRLSQLRDLSADFTQTIESLNQSRHEEGHLYMARSGRARWEYDHPETRIWVMNGDRVVDYDPGQNLLVVRTVDEAYYDRLPLMSVFGRRNFTDEFERFSLLPASEGHVAGSRVLRAVPKRDTDIGDIVIEVDPVSFDIRRLFVRFDNGDTNDLTFSNILVNTGLTDALWDFVPPPGTDVLD